MIEKIKKIRESKKILLEIFREVEMRKRKHHSRQYRTIKGKTFKCMSANTIIFKELIEEAKNNGKKYRIIEFQIYIEQ